MFVEHRSKASAVEELGNEISGFISRTRGDRRGLGCIVHNLFAAISAIVPVVDDNDVGVSQATRQLSFSPKPPDELRVICHPRVQHLDSNPSTQPRVDR